MLRTSLKPLLAREAQARRDAAADAAGDGGGGAPPLPPPLEALPDAWATRRPEELAPHEFVELTQLIFGSKPEPPSGTARVWRKMSHGA